MFSDHFGSKTWPGGKLVSVNSFYLGFLYRAEGNSVQVFDGFGLFCVLLYVVDLMGISGWYRGYGLVLFQIHYPHTCGYILYSLECQVWLELVRDENIIGCEGHIIFIFTKPIKGQ